MTNQASKDTGAKSSPKDYEEWGSDNEELDEDFSED